MDKTAILPKVFDYIEDVDALRESGVPDSILAGRAVRIHTEQPLPLILDAQGSLCVVQIVECGKCINLKKKSAEFEIIFLHRAGPGWCYAFDYNGNYLFDTRNQEFVCSEHSLKKAM